MNYESPLFVNIVLGTLYLLLAVAVGTVAWSVIRGWRRSTLNTQRSSFNVQRSTFTAWASAACLVVVMAVAWLLGSTRPLSVNGKEYTDAFWLRTSDMFIYSALVLLVLTAVCVAISQINETLKKKK
ncbi:MAG: hypothetical protein J5552_05695 [Prevotella sp.]|nr:hypothetical protein [Prevotella sp.]